MKEVRPELLSVIKKYIPLGQLNGGELLLTRENALAMARDLNSINEPLLGITGWRYVDREKGTFVEDLSVDYYVGDDAWFGTEAADKSYQKVERYLLYEVADSADLFTIDLDIPNLKNLKLVK